MLVLAGPSFWLGQRLDVVQRTSDARRRRTPGIHPNWSEKTLGTAWSPGRLEESLGRVAREPQRSWRRVLLFELERDARILPLDWHNAAQAPLRLAARAGLLFPHEQSGLRPMAG